MRVHHLNCGTMCPRPASLLGQPGLFAPARLVCHCLLVELSEGLALIDTGLGTLDVADARRRLGPGFVALVNPVLKQEETALAQVERLGFKAEDVRHALPTHLDLDHAGGISDFPDAEVHVLNRELEAANARATRKERERYRPRQWAKANLVRHEPGGESWFGFEGVRPLAGSSDEVLIIPLFGHTHGHAGIAVRSDNGWLLHAGDAYFHRDEVHSAKGRGPIGLEVFQQALQMDTRQRLHNRTRLRELASSHGAEVTVFCAHDPNELAQFGARS